VIAGSTAVGCGQSDSGAKRREDGAAAALADKRAAPPPADAAGAAGDAGLTVEQLPGFRATAEAADAVPEVRERLADVKAVAPGCAEDPDAAQVLAFPGDPEILVSLAHGAVAFSGGKPVATTAEPLTDCVGSQTELVGAWLGQLVPDPDPELVVLETTGGRNMAATTLHVLKRRDDRFVAVFAHVVAEYEGDEERRSPIEVRADGTIVAASGGNRAAYVWDPEAFRFAP